MPPARRPGPHHAVRYDAGVPGRHRAGRGGEGPVPGAGGGGHGRAVGAGRRHVGVAARAAGRVPAGQRGPVHEDPRDRGHGACRGRDRDRVGQRGRGLRPARQGRVAASEPVEQRAAAVSVAGTPSGVAADRARTVSPRSDPAVAVQALEPRPQRGVGRLTGDDRERHHPGGIARRDAGLRLHRRDGRGGDIQPLGGLGSAAARAPRRRRPGRRRGAGAAGRRQGPAPDGCAPTRQLDLP